MNRLSPLEHLICAKCRQKIKTKKVLKDYYTIARVYHGKGSFHFLCESCQQLPFRDVCESNTAHSYAEVGKGKIVSIYKANLIQDNKWVEK